MANMISRSLRLSAPLTVSLLFVLLSACTLSEAVPPTTTPLPMPTETAIRTVLADHVTRPIFKVFILTSLTTCLVGNEFASGTVCAGTLCGDCSCTWEEHDPPAPQVGVPPDRLDDPAYAGYASKMCVDVTLNNLEVEKIISDMRLVRDLTYEWTGGTLDLQMEFILLPHTFTGFTAPDFVIGPYEIDDELLNAYVGTDTDFVYVVSGNQDRAQGLQLAGWCGSSYGEYTVHGAGYAYIQYNRGACNDVTIAGETIYEPLIHEWMHNLDWALAYVNGVPDLYQDAGPDWANWEPASWPACGMGAADRTAWFPSVDLCEWDPDWRDCVNTASAGACLHAGEVGGADSWYEHVLSVHYPRGIEFNGNFCADGRQDFSETGVDSGFPCP